MTNFKRFLTLFTILTTLSLNYVWGTDVAITAGTNGTAASVNGNTAVKIGTSSKGGDFSITVPSGATKLTLYAAAWKGVSDLSLNITPTAKVSPTSIALTADNGVTSNSPFTLDGSESSYKHEITLSGITTSTTITFATSTTKRCVAWGASYETGSGSCESIGAPSVTATAGNGSISLSWANQTGADSYTVTCKRKSDSSTTGITVGSVTGTTTKSCDITGLTNGTAYTWSVTAVGDGSTYCASGNTAASGDATPAATPYTVRFYKTSSTYEDKTEASGGAGVTPPTMQATCGSYTFQGWSETQCSSEVTTATSVVSLSGGKYYPTAATTLYPIYTRVGGGGASLTKMTSSSTVANGDQLVIIAQVSSSARYGCYQEELSGSYVNFWTLTGEPTASDIDDVKKYFTVSTATGGWYLGDAANGYLYNASSNNLTCPTGDKSIWTITWDGTESAFTITTNSRYLACRSDLDGTNDNKYRMGGATSGTPSGTGYFDLYKYAAGTLYYYSYPTCIICANPTLTFDNSTVTKYVGDANFINTLTVTGNNLPSTISYDSNFKSKATVASDGTVTILQSTAEGTPVTITATRLAANNDVKCDNEVVQTYSLIIKNRIKWFANEVEITSGSQTTEVFYNGSITTLPATPSIPSACSAKHFIGWTDVAEWESDDAPDHLYKTVGDFPKIKENKTFYAVFADVVPGDPISTLTQTLEYDSWSYGGTTEDMDTYRLFGNGAYIESASFDRSTLAEVHVYGGTYGGDSYKNIAVKSGSTTWATESFTSNNQKKEYTLTSSTALSGTGTIKVVSNSGNGSTTGVRISKVEIYTLENQDVTTGYVTKCCTTWDDPTLSYNKLSIAVGESDATKSLSGTTHGTLSFESNNTAVATVDPSSGAVHAVSPGSATINAHWTKSGAYCAKDLYFTFTITGNVTVSFDANGGTGSMADQTGIPYNTATPLNAMSGITAPAGKSFVGWNTQADGKGTSYANGASVKLTTNTTLYAQWGTAYTITLHRGGSTENVTVLSTDFPYTLPQAEADFCDSWAFAGWSETSVANNSTEFTNVTEATTAANDDFYAVYKGNETEIDAYVRISKKSDLESGKQYIFVGRDGDTRYVLPANSWSSTYYNFTGEVLAESGTDYYAKSLIDTDRPTCRWKITGSEGAWVIQNVSSSKYLNNSYTNDWYTTNTSDYTYNITPNGLFWIVKNLYSSASKPYFEFYSTRFTNYTSTSAALQIYKLGKAMTYEYTSTPSGGDCATACSNSGAQFTYPEMEKSTASADFSNTVIYTLATNTRTPAYESNNESVATVNPTTGVVHIVGKGKATITMTQLRDNADPSHPICGVTLSYDVTVTDPSLEVVEVTSDDKIIVEHDFDGITSASVDSSKTEIKGTIADDIFISKYYEAASHMKLFALYNGTEHNIDLSQLRVRSGSSSWGDHGKVQLDKLEKLGIDFPGYQLPPFKEIIFWSNNEGDIINEQLCSCVKMEINGKIYTYEDMKNDNVPGWYHIETDGSYITRFNFDGNDALILERSTDGFSTWDAIDLLGAGTKGSPTIPTGSANGYVQKKTGLNDDDGYYWDASSAAGKELSTNRFYITRLNTVKSGLDAVESNETSFVTLGSEWTGKGIGGNKNMEDYCASGELFSEVAQYDYAGYYTDYVAYEDKWRADDNGDGTLTISFNSGELAKLACKKIKISVTDASDATKKAEVEYRVPIIVKTPTDITQSSLFNSHDKDECKVCDVAILSGGVLTKSKPSTPADVAADRDQVYNVDVYAGGELYVPTGTEFKINTLTVRSTGDEVGLVDVQGKITRNNSTLIHSKRFHNVDDEWRWYYFSLPYDCNVSEVTFSNGDPAVHGADFEIDWYDGESRAASQANGNWVSIANHPDYPNIIKAGYGYTIAVEAKSGHDYVGLHFPMANFKEVSTQVVVPVGNWGAGDDAVEVNHKGWNVIGNPYLNKYKAQAGLDINGALRVGYLEVQSGKWVQDATGDRNINYATVPLNGGKSGYDQQALTNREFNPFQSFIIQVGGDAERSDLTVLLKNAYKKKRASSIVMRRTDEYEVEALTPVWLQLDLTNAAREKDQTTVIISDNYTEDYDMTYDLSKWRGTSYRRYTKPVLASVYNEQELAFNALPDDAASGLIPLTMYAKDGGEMTFALSTQYAWAPLEEVILHDAQLNINHDLLANGAYTFTANAGETSNRFSLSTRVNRHKAPTIATGLDLVDLQNVHVFVHERTLMLNGLEEGTQVYVFDMSGRLVGRQVATVQYMQFNVPTYGVYNIRLVGQKAGITLRALVY